MGSASSLGIFVVRDINAMAALPAQNDSGLWQAWSLADGVVMLQALDIDHAPKGNLYTLPHTEFSALLKALEETPAVGPEQQSRASTFDVPQDSPFAGASPVSDAPARTPPVEAAPQDFSFSQSATPAYGSLSAPHGEGRAFGADNPDTPVYDANKRNSAPRRKLKADDPNLLLFWHEESMRSPDTAQVDLEPSRIASAYDTGIASSAPASVDDAYPQTRPFINAAQQQTRDTRVPDAGEIQARYAEQAMREEFTLLMDAMPQDTQDIPLESAAAALIARDVPFFGRKQKFMFTEFGLALRRKNKCELALLCHLRALNLAPGDENVLFNVARTEYSLGRSDKAAERLDAALQVNPGFTAAAHFLAFLRNPGRQN